MTRDEIIDKLKKIYALVEKGSDGEKQSAELRLKEMMAKYNITLEDIANEEKETTFWYRCQGRDWKTIFGQVSHRLGATRFAFLDPNDQGKKAKRLREAAYDRPRGANTVMITTYAKFIEVTTAYEVYQRSFDEHYDAFVYAFLSRNDLLGKGNPDYKPTAEEEKMLRKAMVMEMGMEKAQVNLRLAAHNN